MFLLSKEGIQILSYSSIVKVLAVSSEQAAVFLSGSAALSRSCLQLLDPHIMKRH